MLSALFLFFLLEEFWMALGILVYWSRYIRSGKVNIRLSFWLNHRVFSFQLQVGGSVDEVTVKEETGREQRDSHVELRKNRHIDKWQEYADPEQE
jgi:hypothetical protein